MMRSQIFRSPADGKSLTPDDVRPMLEQMVKEAVSHIPVPRDGRDYDPDVLQKAVLDAVSALQAPQDGRDATALEILPAIDDQNPFPGARMPHTRADSGGRMKKRTGCGDGNAWLTGWRILTSA